MSEKFDARVQYFEDTITIYNLQPRYQFYLAARASTYVSVLSAEFLRVLNREND